MSEEPIRTPIAESRANTGRAYYSLAESDYKAFKSALDAQAGTPLGLGSKAFTLHMIPEWADVEKGVAGVGLLSLRARETRNVAAPVQELTKGDRDKLVIVERTALP